MEQISTTPHPLYAQIKEKGIRQWQLRRMLGGSPVESKLSRMLNGIDPMPESLEQKIRTILKEV